MESRSERTSTKKIRRSIDRSSILNQAGKIQKERTHRSYARYIYLYWIVDTLMIESFLIGTKTNIGYSIEMIWKRLSILFRYKNPYFINWKVPTKKASEVTT